MMRQEFADSTLFKISLCRQAVKETATTYEIDGGRLGFVNLASRKVVTLTASASWVLFRGGFLPRPTR